MRKIGESRSECARRLFLEGYNCTQAVVGAFSDLFSVDFSTLMLMCCGYGGGIARLREVCGSFIGAVMVLNVKFGTSNPADYAGKSAQYQRIRRMAELFRQRNGSIVCRELLGLPAGASLPTPEKRTAEYYQKRPCPQIIADMASILEEVIAEEEAKFADMTQR